MMGVKYWTKEEDAKLLELRAARYDFQACAEIIGRTHDACRCRWAKIKPITQTPQVRVNSAAARRMAKDLRAQGWVCRPPWHKRTDLAWKCTLAPPPASSQSSPRGSVKCGDTVAVSHGGVMLW